MAQANLQNCDAKHVLLVFVKMTNPKAIALTHTNKKTHKLKLNGKQKLLLSHAHTSCMGLEVIAFFFFMCFLHLIPLILLHYGWCCYCIQIFSFYHLIYSLGYPLCLHTALKLAHTSFIVVAVCLCVI